MPEKNNENFGEWIWIPPGFAHGNFYTEPTKIEYFCTGEYNPNTEAAISPVSNDLDWSICDNILRSEFLDIVKKGALISEKDNKGTSLSDWLKDSRSENFMAGQL